MYYLKLRGQGPFFNQYTLQSEEVGITEKPQAIMLIYGLSKQSKVVFALMLKFPTSSHSLIL